MLSCLSERMPMLVKTPWVHRLNLTLGHLKKSEKNQLCHPFYIGIKVYIKAERQSKILFASLIFVLFYDDLSFSVHKPDSIKTADGGKHLHARHTKLWEWVFAF